MPGKFHFGVIEFPNLIVRSLTVAAQFRLGLLTRAVALDRPIVRVSAQAPNAEIWLAHARGWLEDIPLGAFVDIRPACPGSAAGCRARGMN
jgi:hypothetical protein